MSKTELEKKLAEYRKKKEREARVNYYKSKIMSMISQFVPKRNEKNEDVSIDLKEPLIEAETRISEATIHDSNSDDFSDIEEESTDFTVYDYVYYVLWFVLWVTLYAVFIKLQFGTIYFIVSLLLGIYFNTRTRPKKKNEISAYSVFNRNCESIDGTLNAEQLTRQMVYGSLR